jgi:multidrug transporter EmrE-like cation transporter
MYLNWKSAALAIVLTLLGVGADTLLKLASASRTPFWNRWFALGVLTSFAFAVTWVFLMQTVKLATAGVFYAVASALLLVAVGTFFFDERLTPGETAGVAMAATAVVLLGR